MKLAVALAAMTAISHANTCQEVQYSADTVTPSKGTVLAEITVGDDMHFEFDVTINSFPTGWANVFHCGSSDSIRVPGIWLHPDSSNAGATHEGFHISYSTVSNANPWINPGPELTTGQSYHFELDVTQSSMLVTIDGVVQYENTAYEAHNTYDTLPCYASDPWFDAADVVLENLVISSPGECQVDCSALDIDEFLEACSSSYDDLVADAAENAANIASNTENIATNTGSISSNTAAISTNAAAITELNTRIDNLVIADGQNVVPSMASYNFENNKDLFIVALLVLNLVVILMSVYICISAKGGKYQPVKSYASE